MAASPAKSTWLHRSARPGSRQQPGEYDVLVRDEWFGWGAGNRGAIVVRETGLGTLTVQRDLSASVRPLIDLYFAGGVQSSEEQPHYRFQWNSQHATN